MMLIFIAVAGAIGAICRYVLSKWLQTYLTHIQLFATTIVNCLGSFLLGICFAINSMHDYGNDFYTIVATGFFGAFTTFSTFSYEAVQLYLKSTKQGVYFLLGNMFCAVMFACFAFILVT